LRSNVPTYAVLALVLAISGGCKESGESSNEVYVPRAKGSITFSKDIAPIVFEHCSGCHHPDGPAPFSLLSHADLKNRTKLIVDLTQRRLMPPWLPDRRVVHFVGERGLSVQQIGLIRQWAEEGAPEGRDLPPAPKWNNRWQLGEPDLILKPKVPFTLSAEGRDVYRNLVIPIPLTASRYVRALEFRPNTRAVHHAFFRFDKTDRSRVLDGKDGQPGFGGIHAPRTAESAITFESWQPGRVPRFNAEDLAWPLHPGTDLVLQMHLQPIGKLEIVAPEVAIYFTDKRGSAVALKFPLDSFGITIPPGATNHLETDLFVLPVDVEVRGVLPHAHYLCKTMRGYADLPDGTRRWLIAINNWDFNWQGDYQYSTPLLLPKGTKLVMEYAFDNSAGNPRNPNNPAREVLYGSNTTDEMAELWLQVVMKSWADFETLSRALQPRYLRDNLLANEAILRRNPNDARAHAEIGSALVLMGKEPEAIPRLQTSIQLDPNYDEAHYFLGLALRFTKQFQPAQKEFEAALQLNPKHGRARGNLGLTLMEMGNLPAAMVQFERAMQLNPQDEIAREMLRQIRKAAGGK
jgi:hypothetical protein